MNRVLGILYLLTCVAVLGVFAFLPFSLAFLASRCDTWTTQLLKDDHGQVVWLIEERCSGFYNNGTTEAIAISHEAGAKTTLFRYVDASWGAEGKTAPSAKWTAPDHLEISTGAVSEVLQKLDRVGDVTITYHIDDVWYE
jgi:hypothetical protein